ncbi:uracil-DNA glycosylase [Burkholderia ubonensis]|uniref:uracil-DNA glycosylase n=1 Tax=Burkholderia ubonensis TaxID=101571 RepID=UPI00075D965A|nr:uracil-DNA glycosylase [Burkholderia ubonensis]KVR24531.1 uracil-DNA glycosylase [Burkholderia ubonensis]KWB91803.1 uracil-DNA glycosylase [Burkholderia ubonensis]KWK13676.1 uracil-DNA glycosylase [Burkholderia ubonensis]KWK48654.1 uracil-DNA glycosylase [Burkholderia ubonensis]
MATRKTSRAPQQASLFDDLVTDTPAGSPSSKAAAPAAPAPVPTSAAPSATPRDIQHLAAQFDALPDAWREVLAPFVASDAYGPLCRFVDSERAAGKTVYPTDVFRALRLTSPDDVKVVILGQDPYHGDDRGTPQAHGLAFSVPPAVKPPPSLRNIFKEIAANFGHDTPRHGCLDSWARQGVLLLNTVLTVERGAAASHAKRGWEQCTDTLIHELANRHRGLVFMLWGAHAQAKRALFDANAHCVLEAPHPSPLSAHRGFLGCRHFALANDYLAAHDRAPIDWRLPDEAETFA